MASEQHWCKHYTGTQNKVCERGYVYSERFGGEFGIFHRLPCLCRNKDTVEPCQDFSLYTKEEMEEMDRKGKEAFMDYLINAGIRVLKEGKKNAKRSG